MAGVAGLVDRAYLVSVEGLRDICEALTNGKREYKLNCEDEKTEVISYTDGPDDLNAMSFSFPIVTTPNVRVIEQSAQIAF